VVHVKRTWTPPLVDDEMLATLANLTNTTGAWWSDATSKLIDFGADIGGEPVELLVQTTDNDDTVTTALYLYAAPSSVANPLTIDGYTNIMPVFQMGAGGVGHWATAFDREEPVSILIPAEALEDMRYIGFYGLVGGTSPDLTCKIWARKFNY